MVLLVDNKDEMKWWDGLIMMNLLDDGWLIVNDGLIMGYGFWGGSIVDNGLIMNSDDEGN